LPDVDPPHEQAGCEDLVEEPDVFPVGLRRLPCEPRDEVQTREEVRDPLLAVPADLVHDANGFEDLVWPSLEIVALDDDSVSGLHAERGDVAGRVVRDDRFECNATFFRVSGYRSRVTLSMWSVSRAGAASGRTREIFDLSGTGVGYSSEAEAP